MAAANDLRLLTLTTNDGVELFPEFQLRDGKVVERLQDVLLVLTTGTAGRWTWAQWLNAALPDKDPPRNITLLYERRLEEALRDAGRHAWAWRS